MLTNWHVTKTDTDGTNWVAITARIRKNKTGECRDYQTESWMEAGAKYPSTFSWEENNFACDSNRALLFSDEDPDTELNQHVCDGGLYSVQLINPVTGEVFYDEFDA